MTNTVLVAGASGLVGTAAVEQFLADGWDVIAVSRRRPEVDHERPFRHLAVDLRDTAASQAAFAALPDVTHVVYAAVFEKPGLVAGWRERDQMETNLLMLQNLMEPLRAGAPGLAHVSLLQGTKAYGAHVHPIPVPARERFPRDQHENFYWLQEDFVRAGADRGAWTFTIWRPQLIVGPNYGVVMNVPPIIGAYAAIRRAEGRPFSFPGGASWPWEAVDTRLVASAMAWAARTPRAGGETYNLTNGEVFEWRSMWPALAATLGVDTGPDEPIRLSDYLIEKAPVWNRVVAEHGLRPIPMAELVGESHYYADVCFAYGATAPPPPVFVSTVKIKQHGFTETYDTEESFCHWLRVLMERKILPPPTA
jgi:nucleoside-diphosphate-sugar epimerase